MTPLFRSATLKLTVWYLCLVMVISLIFSAVIFKLGHDELAEGLHNQSARIYQTYPVFSDDPFFKRTSDVDVGSRHIIVNLIYFNAAVLVLAGFASYWLAKRTLEPIAASNERQKRFVADASHELRTPLTAIKMESEVALLDPAAPKTMLRETLQSNLEEAEKLNTLLESLLRLSKLEATTNQPLTATPLTPLITEAIERVQMEANAKHITVTPQLTAKLSVNADHGSLVQLLVILLDNAIKYSHEKSEITVRTKRNDARAIIQIQDHGIGIAPEALDHVFDRFYRADAARTSNNGYGLGLSIAKYIADLHHGTITLTSTASKGTIATVSLPVAPASQPD